MGCVSSCALDTYNNAPCRTRTCDPRIRNPLLYPAELRALFYDLVRGCFRGKYWRDQRMTEAIAEDKETKWTKTRVKHLYRHRDSGRYYVQGYRQRKEIWKALKTKSARLVGRRHRRLSEIAALSGKTAYSLKIGECSNGAVTAFFSYLSSAF